MEKPYFELPALEPEFETSDEWLVHWFKCEWMQPSTFTVKPHHLSEALCHVEAPSERIMLIRAYTWLQDPKLAYGSIVALYASNTNIVPRIPEIDAYHDERLASLGVV